MFLPFYKQARRQRVSPLSENVSKMATHLLDQSAIKCWD